MNGCRAGPEVGPEVRRVLFCPNTPSTAAGVLLSKASDKEQMMVNAKTKMATRPWE